MRRVLELFRRQIMRIYAIGDIHGHLEKLRAVHAMIRADKAQAGDAEAAIVHVGDLVDRGPDVPGVLDYLGAGLDRGENWVVLKGNHDRIMWHFLQDPEEPDPLRPDLHWLIPNMGGRKSLEPYGIDVSEGRSIAAIHADARDKVPAAHVELLGALPLTHRWRDVFFCHAGIRPGVPLEDQIEDDLVWIRGEFLDDTRGHGPLIVHGHSPVEVVTHYGNRLNLDTGAAYGGPLSVVVFEGDAVWQITEDGRLPVARG